MSKSLIIKGMKIQTVAQFEFLPNQYNFELKMNTLSLKRRSRTLRQKFFMNLPLYVSDRWMHRPQI